jgi:hypothetical protein
MSTQLQSFADALSPELREARAEIERLRAELATCEEFLREHHRSNVNWYNDQPTLERVETIRKLLTTE